ncbi:bromodomain-containing protein 4 [Drosophila rhopaloa]|uniref:Bromodomain-containing protein 4 n=1 Tax=Drosophila rhopaloa TaxID=1041015 RepID=A0A6P4EAY3_DRORH|nr:bromodomain-containing protein 4 [Drosophila rhopaloa]
MAGKRTTFDLMNLGYPINSDPYEEHPESSSSPSLLREAPLSHRELRRKLHKEARKVMPDFFPRDPSSSSDDSDDFDFPETLNERARRTSFARRRKLHYNEFATVELARRLIHDEFTTSTDSARSDEIDFIAERAEEECHPCEDDSNDSFPYLQYDRVTCRSQISDDSLPKEDPEPGFDPTHHCYDKIMANLADMAEQVPVLTIPVESEPTPTPPPPPPPPPPPAPEVVETPVVEEETPTERKPSLEKHTRVIDGGEKWDLTSVKAVPRVIRAKNDKSNRSRNL